MTITRLELALMDFGHPKYLVAEAAGMPPSRLSEYSKGKVKIPPHRLIALAEVIGCSPNDLVGEVETDGPDRSYRRRR